MKIKGFKETIDWYNQNSEEYTNTSYNVSPGELIAQFLSMLPQDPHILDAGCGAGRDSGLFQKKSAIVTGLDISIGLLKEAKVRNPQVTFVQGSITDLPFENNSFDGVWARASLVHLETIEDAKNSVKEFQRVLKQNGILHIYTREQLGDTKTALVSDKDTPHKRFFRFYTKEEIHTYLEESGFKIKEISSNNDPHGRKEIKWLSVFAEK